jgi:hypothetical protein
MKPIGAGVVGTQVECVDDMNAHHTDPRLVWLATVLAAAVFVVYVAHAG